MSNIQTVAVLAALVALALIWRWKACRHRWTIIGQHTRWDSQESKNHPAGVTVHLQCDICTKVRSKRL